MARIDTIQTTPIVNLIQKDDDAWKRYADWIVYVYRYRTSGIEAAKRVLGKQDFCWTGYHRHYVWERPFQVDFGHGRVETWHWRLFASKRGLALEVEDKHNEDTKKVRLAGLEHFLKTWEANDP